MAQKVIEGGIVTWRYMHEILRWLTFKLAQSLRSRVKTPRWLKIRSGQYLESCFCSNFELSQSFWSENLSHLEVLTLDRRF